LPAPIGEAGAAVVEHLGDEALRERFRKGSAAILARQYPAIRSHPLICVISNAWAPCYASQDFWCRKF